MKWILLAVVVAGTVVSDLLQSHSMKRAGEQPAGARGLARILTQVARDRDLILSIVCLAFSFFAFVALLQIAALSFAVPASAASFAVEMILAKLLLKERLGPRRSAGAALVLAGVVLLAR